MRFSRSIWITSRALPRAHSKWRIRGAQYPITSRKLSPCRQQIEACQRFSASFLDRSSDLPGCASACGHLWSS